MVVVILTLIAGVGLDVRAETIPVIGVPVPELTVLDGKMTQIMETNGISAASLSVMRNGVVVLHHMYGWQDRLHQKPLRPDALFRLASATKPITAAAVRKLMAGGHITLNTRVFSLGVPGAGILPYSPFGTPDSRLGNITVDHLLKHTGGWDRDIAGDLTYLERTIANAMGVTCPPGRENTVRYIMGRPLQYAPGSTYAYSNIGYLLLGLIIETVSGQDYRSYVQANVIGLDGFTTDDWLLGRTFAADQDPREPFYDEPVLASNVFYPASSAAVNVERPYGSFDLEARTGQGRVVTHGIVLLRYLNRFQVSGDLIGNPRPAPGGWRWNHTGSQPGCNTLARQRGDGVNYVVLFNKRPSSGTDYASQIRTTLDAVFDSGSISSWPSADITQMSPPIPKTTLTLNPPELSCETVAGRHYQWQSSTDLQTWTDYSFPFVGNGLPVSLVAESTPPKRFYRVLVRQSASSNFLEKYQVIAPQATAVPPVRSTTSPPNARTLLQDRSRADVKRPMEAIRRTEKSSDQTAVKAEIHTSVAGAPRKAAHGITAFEGELIGTTWKWDNSLKFVFLPDGSVDGMSLTWKIICPYVLEYKNGDAQGTLFFDRILQHGVAEEMVLRGAKRTLPLTRLRE